MPALPLFRHFRLPALLAGLVLFAFPSALLLGAGAEKPRPNVIMIAVDDLNHWVGYTGRNPQARTPNIDRLAARGVAFTKAYCAVPACEPSRAALLSGQRPWTTGCYLNGNNWQKLIPAGKGLTAQFMQAGYQVSGAGKIYHADTFHPSEWTDYMPKSLYPSAEKGVKKGGGFHEPLTQDIKDEDISDWHIVNWCIEKLGARGAGAAANEPFFIACGLHKPHLPFAVPRKYYELFPRDKIQLPPHLETDLDDIPPAGRRMAKADGDHAKFLKSGRWKDAIQSYLAASAYTDMNIGRLLDALDKSPHRDNTIILLWGDHGWSFGEKSHWRKFALWEEPTRAPLIWVAPGTAPAGKLCARTVDFMDLYPTLCELAGVPVPKHVDGRSLVKLLRDPAAEWKGAAITTHGYLNHSVRTEDWRYIRYADNSEELYDHRADPYEWKNLAARPDLAATKRELAALLPTKNHPPTKPGRTEDQ